MLGPLVNHECVVVVVDGAEDRGWLIQDLLNILNHVHFALVAFKESETLRLIKDGLSGVLRQIDLGIADPFANFVLISRLDVEVAEDLTSLNNGHETLLRLLRQNCILIVAPVDELLLQLGISQVLEVLLYLCSELRAHDRGRADHCHE